MKLLLHLAVLSILLLTSCTVSRTVHSQQSINQPMLAEKGDFEAGMYYAESTSIFDIFRSSRESAGLELQGAYAIADHIAVMGSQSFRWENESFNSLQNKNNPFDTSFTQYTRNITSLGAGYFSAINDGKIGLHFSMYGGVLFGKNSLTENGFLQSQAYNRFHQSSMFGFFAQPGIYALADRFNFSFNANLSYINFKNVTTNFTDIEQKSIDLIGLDGKNLLITSFTLQAEARIHGMLHLRWMYTTGLWDNRNDQATAKKFWLNKDVMSIGLLLHTFD
jgi:hypothetical protein